MADALFYASDHLPIYADFLSLGHSGINDREIILEPSVSVDMISLGVVEIRYELSVSKNVHIEIYNIFGDKVRDFSKFSNSGENIIIWNGEDNNGNEVSSGIYFLNIEADDNKATKKLLLLR